MPHQVPPGQGLGQGLWPNDRSAYSLPGRAGRPGTKKKRPGKVPGLWCVFSFLVKSNRSVSTSIKLLRIVRRN